MGNSGELRQKLGHIQRMQSLAADAPPGHQWQQNEFNEFFAELRGQELADWDPKEDEDVYNILNSMAVSPEVLAVPENKSLLDALWKYNITVLRTTTRLKMQTVTADSLLPMIAALNAKNVAKWGKKEFQQLRENLSNVGTIDGRASTPGALEQYCTFLGSLAVLFHRRPDLKAEIDPEYVVLDVPADQMPTYVASIGAYVPPALHGPLPAQANQGAVPLIYAMPNLMFANHLIGYMSGRVPGLTATVIISPGPHLVF
jgi:hypothetical protein